MKLAHLALATGLLAGGSVAAEPVVVKFAAATVSAGDTYRKRLLPWVQKIEAESGGMLKFEMYPDSVLGKEGTVIDRVVSGVAGAGWEPPLAYGARFADLNVITVPMLFKDSVEASAALYRMSQKGHFKGFGDEVMLLAIYTNPPLSIMMKEPLKSPGNLEGRKLAVGSKLRAELVQAMGGVPVSLTVAETYQALQKGVVDGVMTSYSAAFANKFNEQAHYYLDGPLGGGVTAIFMSRKVFDALPAQARKAVTDNAGGEKGSRHFASLAKEAEVELAASLKPPADTVVTLSGADLAKWQAAAATLTDAWTKSFPGGDKVLADFKAEVAGR